MAKKQVIVSDNSMLGGLLGCRHPLTGNLKPFVVELECADDGSVINCAENNKIIKDKIDEQMKNISKAKV